MDRSDMVHRPGDVLLYLPTRPKTLIVLIVKYRMVTYIGIFCTDTVVFLRLVFLTANPNICRHSASFNMLFTSN